MSDTAEREVQTIDVEPEPVPTSTAVVPQQWGPSVLAELSEDEFNRRLELARIERERIKRVQLSVMKEGVDYGAIPGTDRPTLLKPGAETLNKMARLAPSFRSEPHFGDGETGPHIHYIVTCTLTAPDGSTWEGVGSCNSWEKKYRYRNAGAKCPECGAELRRSKRDPEWYCWRKKGGCGATFPLDQFSGTVADNPDPFELDNTILKMAKKRAFVDATNTAHAASGIFTQDMEEAAGPEYPPAPAQPGPQRANPERKITPAQIGMLWAAAKARSEKVQVDAESILRNVLQWYQLPESTKEIPFDKVDAIKERIEKWDGALPTPGAEETTPPVEEGAEPDLPF